jgi:hypothetical protein
MIRGSHTNRPMPAAQTRTGADWRIRFLSEKVDCRAAKPNNIPMGKMIGRSRFLSRQPQQRAREI